MSKVLIVDDEPAILMFLQRVLEADGYTVVTAETGAAGMDLAISASPDLVILDLGLPDIDGIELTSVLRRWLQAPILILSGLNDEARKVAALDAGADDYLHKPFGIDELRARVRALRRRTSDTGEAILVFGTVSVDLAAGTLRLDDEEVRLTRTEWLLLETLTSNPGKLLTHRRVAEDVWGDGYGDEMRQSLRGHVKSLRAKLRDDATEPLYIRTESGAGYRWIAEPTVERPAASSAGPPEETSGQVATLHDLNNALTVLMFSLEGALAGSADIGDDAAREALREQLTRGQSAARRAMELALDLTRPVLKVGG